MSTYTLKQIARFWAKVDKSSGPDACWPWTASKNAAGYGRVAGKGYGAITYAHRVAHILAIGPVPAGYVIDHLCRNPSCVNPAHLEAVPPRENTLRGIMPNVLLHHARQCIRGHQLTPDNIYIVNETGRTHPLTRCRTCMRAHAARAYQRRRQNAA
jgi:hypothetical protein